MAKGKTPGIKVRVAKDKSVRLVDRTTGRWLATVRWRPMGEMWLELPSMTAKEVVADSATVYPAKLDQ